MTKSVRQYNQEVAKKILERMVTSLADVGVVEQPPKLDGRRMTLVLRPKKHAPVV